jgi:rubrerythrin
MELGTNPTDDPTRWKQESGVGRLEPKRYLSLRSAIEKALEFERAAIGFYNDLANATKDKDHGTYDLALKLLKDELEDEQTMEDILTRLEIQDTRQEMIYQSWQENLMTGREGRSNDMKQKLARVINKTNRCSIKLAMFYSISFPFVRQM